MENLEETATTTTFKLNLKPGTEQPPQHTKQLLMPVLSLGGVSVTTNNGISAATPLSRLLKKSSQNDLTVALSPVQSPVQSSPTNLTLEFATANDSSKFKSLIKRNKVALIEQHQLDLINEQNNGSNSPPDLNTIASRIITKSNRTNSPLLSSILPKPASPPNSLQTAVNSTIYQLKEKNSNSDLKQLATSTNSSSSSGSPNGTNLSLMTNSLSAFNLDLSKTTKTNNSNQQTSVTTPTSNTNPTKLFPDLNPFKLNTDLVTSTSMMAFTNKNVNQAKRRILSVVDAKIKEEKENRLKEFEFLNTIGTGTFGRVMCVKHKTTKKYFALKIMSIINIIKLKQVEHVKNEKNILESIHHPFIVKLFWTHHSDQFLYMMLEYVPGGELFSLLRQRVKFDTKTSVFYAAEIICALEYLHNLQIIYRDLKPENILLDLEGHLKLTDFGFAKRISNKTYTLCGTPEYLAPEVILSRGHDHCCDWWTLGVIIFEFLSGTPPFFDENQYRVYEKILTTKIEWPRHFDSSAKDLIKKLLVSDPTKRLGSGNCGVITPTSSEKEHTPSNEQSVVFLTESTDAFEIKDKLETMTPPLSTSDKTSQSSSTSTPVLPQIAPVSQISSKPPPTTLLTQKQKIINGTEEIKRHRWFISITDWNDVVEKRLSVPFKPEIQFEGDTRNFEKYDTPDLAKTPHATEKQLDVFNNF